MARYFVKTAMQRMDEWHPEMDMTGVSISDADLANGSPMNGDMIAENMKDPSDRWLVAKAFLDDNYKEVSPFSNGRMTFGAAVEALKQGKRVARQGWNGKGMFIFMQVPAEIGENVVPVMQSLPQSVKDEFAKRGGGIRYKNQLAMVYPDSTIYGWVASPSDVLEEDWCILD